MINLGFGEMSKRGLSAIEGTLSIGTDTSKAYSRKDISATHKLERVGDWRGANVDG
jgi:hypothetical protein